MATIFDYKMAAILADRNSTYRTYFKSTYGNNIFRGVNLVKTAMDVLLSTKMGDRPYKRAYKNDNHIAKCTNGWTDGQRHNIIRPVLPNSQTSITQFFCVESVIVE